NLGEFLSAANQLAAGVQNLTNTIRDPLTPSTSSTEEEPTNLATSTLHPTATSTTKTPRESIAYALSPWISSASSNEIPDANQIVNRAGSIIGSHPKALLEVLDSGIEIDVLMNESNIPLQRMIEYTESALKAHPKHTKLLEAHTKLIVNQRQKEIWNNFAAKTEFQEYTADEREKIKATYNELVKAAIKEDDLGNNTHLDGNLNMLLSLAIQFQIEELRKELEVTNKGLASLTPLSFAAEHLEEAPPPRPTPPLPPSTPPPPLEDED
ncbi:MAG TPA: hypothetical protein PLV25_04005, partial [Opitutales bacterium]|nr:hypothetical protein [Opitutales bacterium]